MTEYLNKYLISNGWTYTGDWIKQIEDGNVSLIQIGDTGDFMYFKSKGGFTWGGFVFSYEEDLIEYLEKNS